VRARVLALRNVQLCQECDVLGFVTGEHGQRIEGIRSIARRAGASEEIHRADLVIDASGRGSRTPAWLEALGYAKPEVELVPVDMWYSTRLYEREPEHLNGHLIANIAPTPENLRGSGMLAQEGNRWIVTVAGYFGNKPPTDARGYLEFARMLPAPDVYETIRSATPLSDPVAYHFPANQRRHYERLDRFPAGLLVMGDAVCSFTPIYGQGMTVSALEAMALREHLRHGNGPARGFFQHISRIVAVAWMIAAGGDEKLAGTTKRTNAFVRFIDQYMSRLIVAAHTDPVVAMAFMNFGGFLSPPASLLKPSIALRVLRAGLQRAKVDGRLKTEDGRSLTATST
jgi:2-polyprenyl-6-methoxyphenol hydroxylase-like FAD-dependent oxidoreductase